MKHFIRRSRRNGMKTRSKRTDHNTLASMTTYHRPTSMEKFKSTGCLLLALFLLFILSIFLDDKPTSFHQKQKLTKASKKRPLQQENLACPSPPQRAGDRRLDKTKLSVANYNAEWLFIGQSPHSRQCPGEACTWKNIDSAMKHVDQIALNIIGMNVPDIVHLTEVEGCGVLKVLIQSIDQQLGYDSGYVPYLLPGTDVATGQNVGFITKIDPSQPLERTEVKAEYPIPGSQCGPKTQIRRYGVSKHYFALFHVNDIPIVLSGNHFLAFPQSRDRCSKREAQATVIQKYLSQIPKWTEMIVLGDFNDFDRDLRDAGNNRPISKTVSILKQSREPPLHNIASDWPIVNERYSIWVDKNRNCIDDDPSEHSFIDHVLVSQGLRKRVVLSKPYHNYTEYCGTFNSDHWPVYVIFNMT